MDMDVSHVAAEITSALNVTMNPYSSPESRNHAYEVCEDFKNHSPLCIPCGFLLSSLNNSPIVRHFGLQLIEHSIKFKWNNLKPEEKCFIKNRVLEILTLGTNNILKEQSHIKDLLSRIVVEMIKREWPQQWPDMLQELNTICLSGETQTDLVLLVFLRLAEDLALYQCVPNRRRKEIQQVLSLHLKDLFAFFLKTLRDNYQKYVHLVSSADESEKQQAFVHCRLTETVLRTLAGFVEWVPWSHITADDNLLLQLLCTLLVHNSFRLLAVECLLLIVGRKGKVEDRVPLLVLFSEDAMSMIFSAASSVSESNFHEGQSYLFFKRLCEVLGNLGTQLSALCGTVADVKEPPTFKVFLNSILTYTAHPSHSLNMCTMGMWIRFFQHKIISRNVHLCSLVPKLVEILAGKLLKVGFPSKDDSPACAFSRLEFDSDEEFYATLTVFRGNVVLVLQYVTTLEPTITFMYGAELLRKLLESNTNNDLSKCSDSSLPLQLDAVSCYLETVCNRLYFDKNLKLCPEGIDLLKMLLQFETEETSVLSALLSCMSALFIFLKLDSEIMPSLLNRLFTATVFTLPNVSNQENIAAVRDYRRHAAACIVKICKDHTVLLLPAFDQMYSLVKELSADQERLFPSERCLLLEALMLISNEFKDFKKQSSFLGEVLSFMTNSWISLKKEMLSPGAFISFVGLRDTLQTNRIDNKGNNRAQISHSLNIIIAVLRRSKYPDDIEAARKGGFLVKDDTCVSGQYLRHPSACHLLPLMDGVFSLIRCINSLYEPSVLSSLPLECHAVLEIPEGEKKTILGVLACESETSVNFTTSPYVKIKKFLYFTYETCLQILGSAAQFLGTEFYALPNLSSIIKDCVLTSLEYLPDHMLKPMIHYFLKPLFQWCPPSFYNKVVVSTLEILCPFMLQKLSLRWMKFKEQYGGSVGCENQMTETQEILEDQLNRLLTREYIDMLGCVLRSKKYIDPTSDAMDEEIEQKISNNSPATEKLSDLGVLLLRTEGLGRVLAYTSFKAIQWLDTVANIKISVLCFSVFNQLKQDALITTEQEAAFLLQSALSALSQLGEHEINQSTLISLCLFLYESMRSSFLGLKDILLQISGCPSEELEKFDSMLFKEPKKPFPEKKKKEAFKSLVSEVIGKNIGQCFKNDITIKDLPLFSLPPRCKNLSLIEQENDLGLCSLFS